MSGYWLGSVLCVPSSTLTRLVEQQKGHPARKKHMSLISSGSVLEKVEEENQGESGFNSHSPG